MKKVLFSSKCMCYIFRGIFVVWAAWLLFHFLWFVLLYFDDFNYQGFGLSDWMINYQGGFVRRGIVGEILLQLYNIHPFPLREVIASMIIISFIVLLGMLIKLFNKEGWSYMILLAPFMIVHLMGFSGLEMRRDFIALLVTWGIFFFYHQYKSTSKRTYLLGMQLLSVFTILMHEASFFFTFPILFINYFLFLRKYGHKWCVRVVRTVAFFLPALITMFLACAFNGDGDVANAIWASWQPCIERFPIKDYNEMGDGVAFLSNETAKTMLAHWKLNFHNDFWNVIPGFPFTIANVLLVYYLVMNMNTIDLGWNKTRNFKAAALSNILLIQFVFLLPMFTVLSVDWGRTLPYWVVSSLVAYHYFKEDDMSLHPIQTIISVRSQDFVNHVELLKSPWLYLFVMFALPLPFCFGSTIWSSNLYRLYSDVKQLISMLL